MSPNHIVKACLVFGVLGCSPGSAASPNNQDQTFVAFASNFSGFRTWPSTPGVAPGAPQPPGSLDGGLHSGPLVTYINQKPPHGSTSFPIGTIIVKEPTTPPLTERQIFAMVKRGGGFDLTGVTNWEWFELQNVDQNDVNVIWRGIGPPSGEVYAATPDICNACHELARDNDFVWTEGLQLSSF